MVLQLRAQKKTDVNICVNRSKHIYSQERGKVNEIRIKEWYAYTVRNDLYKDKYFILFAEMSWRTSSFVRTVSPG